MEGFRISVIIAAFEAEKYIADAIDSVLRQTYNDFEIVVVDDGSTDTTQSVVLRYAASHPNIHFQIINHAGVCRARNTAIGLAKGDYLFFLDSDDAIHPCLFEEMISAVRATGATMATEEFCAVNHADIVRLAGNYPPKSERQYCYRNNQQTIEELFRDSPFNMIGGLLVKKDAVKSILFDERFSIGEDKLYLYECVTSDADSVTIPEKWYYNRIHQGNSSRNDSREAFLSRYMRRKVFWLSELQAGRPDHARQQIVEGFGMILQRLIRYKSIGETAFLSHIIRRDRKYFAYLQSRKYRLLVFMISTCNPLLLFKSDEPALDIWKKTGLF